ncbi:zinc-ribbon domain-containing protein [Deinococcus arboris]
MATCPDCGHSNLSGIAFCDECGYDLSSTPTSAAAVTNLPATACG